MNMNQSMAEDILGHNTYMKRYGKCSGRGMPDLIAVPEEGDDWHLHVELEGQTLRLLCCPEDQECDNTECLKRRRCCQHCRIPVCSDCEVALIAAQPRMPPAALTNDMMVFYAPVRIYTNDVTVVEMICASVCITSMICCTLELKHRRENPLDSNVHMPRHRMGARGNATSFPLPWSDLLNDLVRLDELQDAQQTPDLPWTGAELSDKVSILLKTFDDELAETMAKVVHQALVRRHVVLQLIQGAKNRGHKAYVNVDMERARVKAQNLPEKGVPAELIRLLPHVDHLDKVLPQKAGTPTAGRSDLEGAGRRLATMKPNGVMNEKNSQDDADLNAQRLRALHSLNERLNVIVPPVYEPSEAAQPQEDRNVRARVATEIPQENVEASDEKTEIYEDNRRRIVPYVMATGNNMIDQFNSWYFGIAFAFVFKYFTGMPDMLQFAEKQRYRREAKAPRIEPPHWVQVMSRKIEAQLQRDWHFGFVSWKYLFRATINFSKTLYSYESANTPEGRRGFTAQELQEGAISLCKALHSSYTDIDGKKRGVQGDITKIKYVPGSKPAAKRLLQTLSIRAARFQAHKKLGERCVSKSKVIASGMECSSLSRSHRTKRTTCSWCVSLVLAGTILYSATVVTKWARSSADGALPN